MIDQDSYCFFSHGNNQRDGGRQLLNYMAFISLLEWTYAFSVSNVQSLAQTENIYMCLSMFRNATALHFALLQFSQAWNIQLTVKCGRTKTPWCAIALLIVAQESSKESYSTNSVCFVQVCFHNLSLYKTQCSRHKTVTDPFPRSDNIFICARMYQQEAKHTCLHMRWHSGGPDFSLIWD